MYQKDYILRISEMIAKMIAGILGKIINKDFTSAAEDLQNIYYDILKEDASFFTAIPEKELTNKLLLEHNYTNEHLAILAELFFAEAELSLAQGNEKASLEFFRKSLLLFEFTDRAQKTFSLEKINRMDSIRKRIELLKNSETDIL